MTEWLLVLVSLLLVATCGAFVAAEFSFVTVGRAVVEQAAAGGDRRSRGVLSALRTLSTQLSGAQLGITITNLAIGFLAEPAVARLLDDPLAAAGVPKTAAPGVAVTAALILATAVTMVFGELVPKNLALARPLPTARSVQGFQRGFTRATKPVIVLLNRSANRALRWMGVQPHEELASARSPEELTSLVHRSAEKGTLPAGTAALLARSLEFGRRRAEDVLTPRVRVDTVSAADPVLRVVELTRATGHSRFPVLGADQDDVVGIVHVKHVVAVEPGRRGDVPVPEVMIPPVLAPKSLGLDALLDVVRSGGVQMAVVIDEFGGMAGIVTFEDLVEEIVGEIRDEYDRAGSHARRQRDGAWSLSGLLRPDEVEEITGVALPEEAAYETVAGLVVARLARLPAVGDAVRVGDVRLVVERLDGRRVDRVRLDARRFRRPLCA